MIPQSVKKTAEILEPVKKYVEACWNSPKRHHVFCLVEGAFDKYIYRKRLNSKDIEVKIAADDHLNHNRSSVHYLVEDLRKLHPQGRFIGIRDKDYMSFLGQSSPNGIYVTDNRDLEMMILASPSFQSSHPDITNFLPEIFASCVPMAHIRIYAETKHLNRKLNDKMSVTTVYDQRKKKYAQDVKDTLQQVYFSKVDTDSNAEDLNTFISSEKLSSFSEYDICRGHDVIGLMEFVYGNSYSKEVIEEKMEQSYDKIDFYKTTLFANINNYCMTFGINAHI